MKNKVHNVIKQMTLEEKAALVNGATFFGTAEISRLGIERLQMLDGGTGINFEQLFGDFYSSLSEEESTNGMIGSTLLQNVIDNFYNPEKLSANEIQVYEWIKERLDERTGMPELAPGCFPPGILLGATFNPETAYEIGKALGLEAFAYKIDVLLGTPNVNIHRDPLNGRLFEGYSEDPCLVSTLAPQLVRGVQEYPVAANVKHFAANNQESNRVGINETISKRSLEEIYFPGFKSCVTDGKVKTVMSAYNKINGTACTESEWLLKNTLRDEWGFDGTVMSDWGAVYHPVKALAAGNDLAMPGPIDSKPIVAAVNSGALSVDKLNTACENMLSLIFELSEKKYNYSETISEKKIMSSTDEIALNAALEGIILLKNENNIFPLHKSNRIILTGSGRENLITCGSGSAGITTNRNTSFNNELEKIVGSEQIIVSEDISDIDIKADDVIIAVASLSGMEGNDRPDMQLSAYDREVLEFLSSIKRNKPTLKAALILNVCGPVELVEYEPYLDGIFCMFLPGMMGGKAMAQLICGKANPSGKLPITFPKYYHETPTSLNFPGDGNEVYYGEGIYVGYRYYDKKQVKPMYHFGYGLSYTNFEIYDIKTNTEEFTDKITVTGKIKNTGKLEGAQVVQIYVSDVVSSVPKPTKELKKFKKVLLQPNEEKMFSFILTEEDFSYFDMDYDSFLCEEGYFNIIVSTSSREEDCVAVCRVYKKGTSPYSFGLNSTVKVMYENERLKKALYDWFRAEGLDRGIVDSNYQYTPSRRICEIIPSHVDVTPEANPRLKEFISQISLVEKL